MDGQHVLQLLNNCCCAGNYKSICKRVDAKGDEGGKPNRQGRKQVAHQMAVQGRRCDVGVKRGLARFGLDHRLEEGDVCVFELVDRENFGLLVHIFRVLGRPEEDLGVYRPTPHKSVKGGSDQQRRKCKTPDPLGIHQDPLGIQGAGNGLRDSSRKNPPPRTLDEDVGHGFTRGDFIVDGSVECHKVANLLPNFNLTPNPSCVNAVTNDTQPGSETPLAVRHYPISEEIASPVTDSGNFPYRSKLLTKRKMEQDNRDSLIKMARELVIQNTSLILKPPTPPPAQAMGIKESQQKDGQHFINLDLMSPQVCKVEPPSSSRLNFRETADSPVSPQYISDLSFWGCFAIKK